MAKRLQGNLTPISTSFTPATKKQDTRFTPTEDGDKKRGRRTTKSQQEVLQTLLKENFKCTEGN